MSTIDDEAKRRATERATRQRNSQGHTTMISPVARLMTASLRDTTPAQAAEAERYVRERCLGSGGNSCVIIGKSTCPRCLQAVQLLTSVVSERDDITLSVFMLDLLAGEIEEAGTTVIAVQDFLWDLTGARTMPRIFGRDGKSLGGYDDVLEQVEQGSLRLSAAAPAIAEPPLLPAHRFLPVSVRVCYSCRAGQITATAECYVLPSMTGLQMKSAVLRELNLPGGFGDYYLRCNDTPFGSRAPLQRHPQFGENCLLTVSDVGQRPRAVGHT